MNTHRTCEVCCSTFLMQNSSRMTYASLGKRNGLSLDMLSVPKVCSHFNPMWRRYKRLLCIWTFSLKFFLGIVELYAKSLCNISDKAKPLRVHLHSDKEVFWTAREHASFGRVKMLVSNCSSLAMFNMPCPTNVSASASKYIQGL